MSSSSKRPHLFFGAGIKIYAVSNVLCFYRGKKFIGQTRMDSPTADRLLPFIRANKKLNRPYLERTLRELFPKPASARRRADTPPQDPQGSPQ